MSHLFLLFCRSPGNLLTALGVVALFSTASAEKVFNIDAFAGVSRFAMPWDSAMYSGDGGAATSGYLTRPNGLWVTTSGGTLLFADVGNKKIRTVDLATNILGTFANTEVTNAAITPSNFCGDTAGTIYVINDGGGDMRKISAAGILSRFAGTGTDARNGDGGQATSADFSQQRNCAVDSNADVYITDSNGYTVRKVTVNTGIVNLWAGNGADSNLGQNGQMTSISIHYPYDVFVNTVGDVYFTEANTGVVRVNTHGTNQVTTYSGVSGYGGQGRLFS